MDTAHVRTVVHCLSSSLRSLRTAPFVIASTERWPLTTACNISATPEHFQSCPSSASYASRAAGCVPIYTRSTTAASVEYIYALCVFTPTPFPEFNTCVDTCVVRPQNSEVRSLQSREYTEATADTQFKPKPAASRAEKIKKERDRAACQVHCSMHFSKYISAFKYKDRHFLAPYENASHMRRSWKYRSRYAA